MGFLGGAVGNVLKSVGKGVLKGVTDILPIPKVFDAVKDLKIEQALETGEFVKRNNNDRGLRKVVSEFLDILDDGKKNHSYSQKKVETISRILSGILPLVAWLLHGISTGNWLIF